MKITFDLIEKNIIPDKYGTYIVIENNGEYSTAEFCNVYGRDRWNDIFENEIEVLYWLKEIKK